MKLTLLTGVLAAATAFAGPAFSQSATYSSGSIYDLDPPAQQSSAGAQYLEAMISSLQAGRMRRIEEFNEADFLRRLGRPVGRLAIAIRDGNRERLGFCTATLVDVDLILTNHHCLVDNAEGEAFDALLWMGYLRPGSRSGVRQYAVELEPVEESRELDYALHKVRGRPGDDFGVARLDRSARVRDRQSLFLVHHPAGDVQHVSLACESGSPAIEGVNLYHRCDTLGGSSGAPVFDNESRRLVGLHYRWVIQGELNAAKDLARVIEASPTLQRLATADDDDRRLASPSGAAAIAWSLLKESADIETLKRFAERFPASPEAAAARARVESLGTPETLDTAAAPQVARPGPIGPTPVHACDREVAGEGDMPDLPGLPYARINPESALEACEKAVREYPDEPRFWAWYGIALYKAERYEDALHWSRKAADAGNADGMTTVGAAYVDGRGVEKDAEEAMRWFRRGAEGGDPEAMTNIGQLVNSEDAAEALRWYRRAAEAGDSRAMNELGYAYAAGTTVPVDNAAAFEWYRRSAKAGFPMGMSNLGFMYANGLGVAVDEAEATRWYIRAAEAGHSGAMFTLGVRYANGSGIDPDLRQALAWYRRAADEGVPEAMFNVGNMYSNGEGVRADEEEARVWWRRAAEAGYTSAMYNLAGSFLTGAGGMEKDEAEARRWFKAAAEGGLSLGMSRFGEMLLEGVGGPRDLEAGVGWILKAVADGLWSARAKLQFGSRQVVTEAQRQLARSGHYRAAIDGIVGPRFLAALDKIMEE